MILNNLCSYPQKAVGFSGYLTSLGYNYSFVDVVGEVAVL